MKHIKYAYSLRGVFSLVCGISILTLHPAFAAQKNLVQKETIVAQKDSAQKETAVSQETVTLSEKTRQDIGNLLAAGEMKEALQKLEEVVTSGAYPELNDWATQEMYKIAQEQGWVPAVISALTAKDSAKNKNIHLKKAIAEGYVRLRSWSDVVRVYEELTAANPDDSVSKTRLIDYYILADQPNKAVTLLEPIVTRNPDDIYYSDLLMNAYVRAGMKDKALAIFQKRVAVNSSSPGLRGRYAQALQDFGLLKDSLKEWQKAAELDPSNRLFQQKIGGLSSQVGTEKGKAGN